MIENNIFEWLGENGIATWGETKDYDGTSEAFPMFTIIRHNVFRELGIYQKQSSAVAVCKAALTTIEHNLMFNMGRAAINFNDNLGGGDLVFKNLLFNTCRESGTFVPSVTMIAMFSCRQCLLLSILLYFLSGMLNSIFHNIR